MAQRLGKFAKKQIELYKRIEFLEVNKEIVSLKDFNNLKSGVIVGSRSTLNCKVPDNFDRSIDLEDRIIEVDHKEYKMNEFISQKIVNQFDPLNPPHNNYYEINIPYAIIDGFPVYQVKLGNFLKWEYREPIIEHYFEIENKGKYTRLIMTDIFGKTKSYLELSYVDKNLTFQSFKPVE